jgi:5-methylcytosine-specific restriction endonuclease McrA
LDIADSVAAKAHLIPDQQWLPLFDALDKVIDDVAEKRMKVDSAYMEIRRILKTRPVYQCRECGRLFVDDRQHKAHVFTPASDETGKEILSS